MCVCKCVCVLFVVFCLLLYSAPGAGMLARSAPVENRRILARDTTRTSAALAGVVYDKHNSN